MENWDITVKDHVKLIHSKGGQYKTTLKTSDTMYLVVTRVNYLVIKLWVDYINEVINDNPTTPKTELITKINWLVMLKSYRRELENKLKNNSKLR